MLFVRDRPCIRLCRIKEIKSGERYLSSLSREKGAKRERLTADIRSLVAKMAHLFAATFISCFTESILGHSIQSC